MAQDVEQLVYTVLISFQCFPLIPKSRKYMYLAVENLFWLKKKKKKNEMYMTVPNEKYSNICIHFCVTDKPLLSIFL